MPRFIRPQLTNSLAEVEKTIGLERRRKYPESAKLADAQADHRAATDLLEWLETQGLHLCVRSNAVNNNNYDPTPIKNPELVLKYLGIDPDKLEGERRAMLDELQQK